MSLSQQTPVSPPSTDEFPLEELSKHRGCWVAFSADGRRLIASSLSLTTLDEQVRAAGEDPEEVLLELIPGGKFVGSGSELS